MNFFTIDLFIFDRPGPHPSQNVSPAARSPTASVGCNSCNSGDNVY